MTAPPKAKGQLIALEGTGGRSMALAAKQLEAEILKQRAIVEAAREVFAGEQEHGKEGFLRE